MLQCSVAEPQRRVSIWFTLPSQTENLRKPQNLAGNPLQNQAKRKVWKCQSLRKPPNLAVNPFKNQDKLKV